MMASTELFFEHLKGQAQFAYFQLGVAASAMAFAIHETDGQALRDTPWPIGAAVSLWAISFAFGCFGVQARQQAMATNARYLDATNHASRKAPDAEVRRALEKAKAITQRDLDRPLARFKWQQWTLFGGALFYIAGHVMQMAAMPAAHREKAAETRMNSAASSSLPGPKSKPFMALSKLTRRES